MPTPSAVRKSKASRAGGYHVRTGCKTCKIRHVKCDEGKPACLKCTSTGRVCDGYRLDSKRHSPVRDVVPLTTSVYDHRQLVQPGKLQILTLLSPNLTGTNRERQCFEYFRTHIGNELFAALLLQPTYQFILQACHADNALRYAVFALGSMGQRLRVNHLLTSDNQEANAHHEYARVQYCKALKHLRERICNDSENSVDLAIVSCFLLTVFEFLQGNDHGSIVHLRSGLSIIQRENALNGIITHQSQLRTELTRVFDVMDLQATMWLGLKSLQSPVAVPFGGQIPRSPSLNHFNNLEEAADALNFQLSRMYHFRRLVSSYGTSQDNIFPAAYAARKQYHVDLETWPAALETLLKSIGHYGFDLEVEQRITVMQINHRVTRISLESCLEVDEPNIHRDHEAEFRHIVSLAKSVICPMNDTVRNRINRIVAANAQDINPSERFSFFAGIIHPLYVVAISCRSLDVCQEVVSLLSTSPWREGAWDSIAMARIAERKIQQLAKEGYYGKCYPRASNESIS